MNDGEFPVNLTFGASYFEMWFKVDGKPECFALVGLHRARDLYDTLAAQYEPLNTRP